MVIGGREILSRVFQAEPYYRLHCIFTEVYHILLKFCFAGASLECLISHTYVQQAPKHQDASTNFMIVASRMNHRRVA